MTAPAENVSCVQAGRVRGDNESLRRSNQAFTAENARLRRLIAEWEPIVKAAEYQYGDLFCINGDCDHAAEVDDDAPEGSPCPLVETRYATGAEITALTPLLMSTDGDQLDDGEEIPVGEIRRVLAEARGAVNA